MLKGQGLLERRIAEKPKERRGVNGQMVVVKHDKEELTRQTLHSESTPQYVGELAVSDAAVDRPTFTHHKNTSPLPPPIHDPVLRDRSSHPHFAGGVV